MKENNSSKPQNKNVLKRKSILEAAAKVFSEKGYIDSSIKNITDEASVAVGTFYTYFDNKEEVLEAIYEEIFDMSLQITSDVHIDENDSVVKKFAIAMASSVWTYVGNKELTKLLLIKSMGINELFEKKQWEIKDKTRAYLRKVLEHLNLGHAIDIKELDVTSVMLSHSIFGVIIYYVEGRFSCNLKDMIFSLCTYHLNALKLEYTNEEVYQYINQVLTAQ